MTQTKALHSSTRIAAAAALALGSFAAPVAAEATSQAPASDGEPTEFRVYDFAPDTYYTINSAPLCVTDIALQPGEKHLGPLAAGDTLRWGVGVSRSGATGAEQEHVMIKPSKPGIATNMVIHTDRRTYYLSLHAQPRAMHMIAVKWRYPTPAHHEALLSTSDGGSR